MNYSDKLALKCIELTTGLKNNSKQSQKYLEKAKEEISNDVVMNCDFGAGNSKAVIWDETQNKYVILN